ncbi:AraC family transcriptional regulator [Parabacteroides sp. PFB2-12]|uniref:GyrI-like domain-containing protein n=1 Tax=unclassified Parabacteroides TaxID=2649774 RepID=UPI002473114E|nr:MULTISPECIES: GyrI-like domain-containing protein [unclassified Parabacteroides]MDH6343510.1 AraC family transcriptional regulator [Parabacteroides sp. PM6-13]MDH6390890.1 AraC family transcriptional regulator [Parabacteroides sp. PFB2-12]
MNQADKQYCQSCGMPLRFDVEEYLGTNSDHSRSDEYCYYCLKGGDYTVDIPMSEMVDIWVKYTDKYNWYSHTNYTPQELRTLLSKRLPTLKRWRQKEETESLHQKAVSQVKAYIDKNLFATLDPEQLAAMATLSFFHFRKVFRNTTGENVGTYIQRLRLEYVAHLLIATDQSIGDIQQQTNYETKFSLAKAFKKHFGISMSNYRTKYQSVNTLGMPGDLPIPEIRRINTLNTICLDVNGAFRNAHTYQAIWEQLKRYKEKYQSKTANNHFISISQDNPQVTSPDLRRLYIGFITDEYTSLEGKFTPQEISGGIYAVFTHQGSYSQLPNLYKTIHEQWLPHSRYIQKHPLSFEVYLNTPDEVAEEELITEVYIPIDKG